MSFLEEIGAQENESTSLTKDSNKEKPDSGSAGVASQDQLDSSGDKNATNEESEEEQSSGMAPMGVIKIKKITLIRTTQIWRMKQTVWESHLHHELDQDQKEVLNECSFRIFIYCS